MAVVCEAKQISLDRRVAIKLLAPLVAATPQSSARFRREARAGGRLHHPGIVQTYAVGEVGGLHYIVQELVPGGESLEHYLARCSEEESSAEGFDIRGHFEWVVDVFVKLADAFEYAHEKGVIHRDIKPSNILISGSSEPRVVDFGLAKVARSEDVLDGTLSTAEQVVGSIFYMAPEQVRSGVGDVDHRSDVFSLGATMYEALTFRRPHEGDPTQEILWQVRRGPKNPRAIRPNLPPELAAICLKALDRNPEDRYQSMGELAADLRRFRDHEPIRARTPILPRGTGTWLRRNAVVVAALAVGLILAVTALVLLERFGDGGSDVDTSPGAGPESARAGPGPDTSDYEEALAWHRSREAGGEWRVVRTLSRQFVLKTTSGSNRLGIELTKRLEALFALFDRDWTARENQSVAVVRICSSADELAEFAPQLAGGDTTLYDARTAELVIDASGAASRARLYADLPGELFRQYVRVNNGPIEAHPWFQAGFGVYYDGARAGADGSMSVPPADEASPLRVRAKELARQPGLISLRELLTADRSAWRDLGEDGSVQAWSFAAMLLTEGDNGSETEARTRYLAVLETGFQRAVEQLAEEADPPSKGEERRWHLHDLPEERRERIRREAFDASWDRTGLQALQGRWEAFVRDRL